jgi:hypothetical protein
MTTAPLTQATAFLLALVATAAMLGGLQALADATPPAEGALLARATIEPVDSPEIQRVIVVGHHQA